MSALGQDTKDKGFPLSVLILEDREADAELMIHELRKAGYNPTWQRVETEAGFRQHLDPSLDVILADYNLPQFTGLQAIDIVIETDLDIPVIVVTGTIEETALECLRQGAADYILKDRLGRLGPAVKKALEERIVREEKKNALEALRASEQRYRGVAETALTGLSITDPDENITYSNQALTEMLGYTAEELLGLSLSQLMEPEDFSKIKTQTGQRKQGLSSQYETRMKRKDGETRTVIVSASPLTSKDGKYEGSQAVITDITERVRAEAKFRIIFESAPDPYYLSDLKGKFVDGNEAAERIMGYKRDELKGRSFLGLNLLPKNQIPKAAALLARNVLGKRTGPDEFTLIPKDGSEVEVEIATHPVVIDGKTLVLGIARDITERKQAEEAQRQSEERYRAVVEHSHNGILIVSDDFKFEYVNDQLCQVLGRSREEIIGHPFTEFLDEQSQKLVVDRYTRRQRGEEVPAQYEFNILRKDGEPRRVEISSALVKDPKGKVITIAQIMDITERVRVEREIHSRTEDLTLINTINMAINRGANLPEIMKVLTAQAKRVFNSQSVTIYLVSEDGKFLEMQNIDLQPATVKRVEKLIGTRIPDIRIPLTEGGLSQELLLADGPRLINDAEIIQRWMMEFTQTTLVSGKSRRVIRKLIPQIYKLVGAQSLIIVPLESAGERIGLMDLSRHEPFLEEDIERVADIGGQVTAAIASLRAKEAQRESMERFQEIFEGVNDAIFVQGLSGEILNVNARACDMYGYSKEDLLNKTITDLAADSLLDIPGERMSDETLPTKPMETNAQHANGESFPIEITIRHQTIGGEVVNLLVVRDITERKRDQAVIEHQLEHMEALRVIDQAIIGTLDLGVTLDVVLEQVTNHLELDAADILLFNAEREVLEFSTSLGLKTDALQHTKLPLGESYAGQVARSRKLLIVKDLREDPGGFNASPRFTEEGFVTYICIPLLAKGNLLGVLELFQRSPKIPGEEWFECLDMLTTQAAIAINSAKQYEELEYHSKYLEQAVDEATGELRQSKEQVETILDNSPNTVLLLAPEGTIQLCNSSITHAFGYSRDEIRSEHVRELVDDSVVDSVSRALKNLFASDDPISMEILAVRKDKTTFEAMVNLATIRPDNRVQGIVCTIMDISALKEIERMKDSFVSNVSHELRTPITSLRLNHGLMVKNPGKQGVYLERLDREINRLNLLIEDLLRLSRLDQGQVQLELAPVDLNNLAAQLVEDRASLAASTDLDLEFSGNPELPLVNADNGLIGQVLSVLLTNAMNYTPPGGEIIVQAQAKIQDGHPWAGFSVCDTGSGIGPEEQTKIFDRFFRGKVGRESGAPGTGLGLAIASEIVKRHHGHIDVESTGVPGEGTTFKVWLPAAIDNNSVHE